VLKSPEFLRASNAVASALPIPDAALVTNATFEFNHPIFKTVGMHEYFVQFDVTKVLLFEREAIKVLQT
jgi:hypothetical protein